MKNIYVGNLDFNTTEESLRSLFEQHGAVESVNMIRDRDTGQPRGFAFVEMTDAEEADRAIAALNGAMVGSRAITVNEARPRAERPGRSGGGRGPGGGGGGYPRRRREPRW